MNFLLRLPAALLFFVRGGAISVAGNLSLAVISVGLATSLWLYVTDKENPTQVQAFNSSIPVKFVNVPNDLAVANASEASVRIRIEAPTNELGQLRADDFNATVNLGGMQKGQASIAIDVTPPNSRINVVDVSPSRIDVTLESVRSKEVPIEVALVGSPQQGFASVGKTSDPQTAIVSGPESLVALVDRVAAEVNLTGLRVDVADDRASLKPRDARGGEISGVKVAPDTASVSVNLEQREFSLEFVVNPLVTGQPASGYNIVGVTSDPRLITLTGPLDVLQSIDAVRGIATEEIAIADARSDVVRQVQVTLPQGVRAQGSSAVRVTVGVRPAQGELTFRIAPQIRNVGAGLVVSSTDPVSVTLSGDVPTLQAVTPETITVIGDAAGLPAGLHAIPLQLTPPAGTTLVRAEPATLGVALVPRQ